VVVLVVVLYQPLSTIINHFQTYTYINHISKKCHYVSLLSSPKLFYLSLLGLKLVFTFGVGSNQLGLLQEDYGSILYPAFLLNFAQIHISSNPGLPIEF